MKLIYMDMIRIGKLNRLHYSDFHDSVLLFLCNGTDIYIDVKKL